MNIADAFAAFAAALRESAPTRTISVVERRYDPTYGPEDYERELTVIEFDDLLRAIDDFGRQLRERQE